MTNLHVPYLRVDYLSTNIDKAINEAKFFNSYKKNLRQRENAFDRMQVPQMVKYNTIRKEEKHLIKKEVDHTEFYHERNTGSVATERHSTSKWEEKMRRGLDTTAPIIQDDEDEEESNDEPDELNEIIPTWVITEAQKDKFIEQYPDRHYRVKDEQYTAIINKPKHVLYKDIKMPKGWKINSYFIRDIREKKVKKATNFHIANFNVNYIAYINPEDYVDIYGTKIKTKKDHTDDLETHIKYLLRFRGLTVIFRTPFGDYEYETKGRHENWDTLNKEFLDILETLVKLQPVPYGYKSFYAEYQAMADENRAEIRDYVINTVAYIKQYQRDAVESLEKYITKISDEDELQALKNELKNLDTYEDAISEVFSNYKDLVTPTSKKYSVYANEWGFTLYANDDNRYDFESLLVNKYYIDNGLVHEYVDIEAIDEELENIVELIKSTDDKGVQLALASMYLKLDAKKSREMSPDSVGYKDDMSEDFTESVEDTVLNHETNYEISSYEYYMNNY